MAEIFLKLPRNKISISFTWDDNSNRHYSLLAPIFLENGFRCTFYIVPGEHHFEKVYSDKYYELAIQGFEIGSHSFSHKYMTSLTIQQQERELSTAVKKICSKLKIYPLTFAFPYHDYNETLVEQTRIFHLETRNTLKNSIRYSIKTQTSLQSLKEAIENSQRCGNILVFSGHSLITEEEYLLGLPGEGYEPMRTILLKQTLEYLRTIGHKAEVITFAKAVLRQWIMNEGVYNGVEWVITMDKLAQLSKYEINEHNITSLI